MSKKKPVKRKNSKTDNRLWFIVTFLIILIVSVLLGFYFSNNKERVSKDNSELKTPEKPIKTEKSTTLLNGTWVSEYDGAIMEIKGHSFTLEMPSVSNGTIIKGTIQINGKEVSLTYVSGSETCKQKQGKYAFEIKNNKLVFKLINDECKSRADRMSAAWFRL
jgi:uncharacterized protein YxeA